ncbi:MAG: hemerythrin domain-containing protein [Blastocatellia bacterium]
MNDGGVGSRKEMQMTNPFHTLKHEHRIIERGLRALDGLCLRLEWGSELTPDALSQIVDFTTNFINRFHHDKEEQCLFPLLVEHGISEAGGPLGAMKREHTVEIELTANLSNAIEGCRKGDVGAIKQFVEAAYRYSAHLIGHMQKEEAILFRVADELLDDEEKDELMAGFRRAEATLGAGVYERYEKIATELEKNWAV